RRQYSFEIDASHDSLHNVVSTLTSNLDFDEASCGKLTCAVSNCVGKTVVLHMQSTQRILGKRGAG
ncbi:MAG: hypothetical protein AAGB13_06695, partial [Cyanobacteria bacterium P01_F01_bin.33]